MEASHEPSPPTGHPLHRLLHDEKISEFNKQKPQEGINLRGATCADAICVCSTPAASTSLNAYFRSADLRGIDLREANLRAPASPMRKSPGVYFPAQLVPTRSLLVHAVRHPHAPADA